MTALHPTAPNSVADSAPSLDIFRLDGRTAIVTGGSSGLGARFVHVLAAAGANVVAAARRTDRLDAVCAGFDRALPVHCDVSVVEDRHRLVETARHEFGSVDILVNNAGVTHIEAAESESLERFAGVLDVNLISSYGLLQLVVGDMLERGTGTVVNVASMLGMVGIGRIPQSGYTASKGAWVNLTRELAAQWARRGVRVNALAPGWFDTELTTELFGEESGSAWINRNTPMGRGGRLDELDAALLFLVSPANTFMTGQTVVVDGGWTAV